MAEKLSNQEIKKRLQELANLKVLHKKSVEQNIKLRAEVKVLKRDVKLKDKRIAELEKKLESALVSISELQQIVFGKKNKKDNDKDDNNNWSLILWAKKSKERKLRSRDSYNRDIPDCKDITDTRYHKLNNKPWTNYCFCPDCNIKLRNRKIVIFYEEDIPLSSEDHKLKTVTEHQVEKWYCPKCKKWISAFPIPPKKVIIWDKVKLYICYLSILMRLSISQIQYLLKDTFYFKVSDWEIRNILEEVSDKFSLEHERIKDRLRKWKWVHLDETSWWPMWLWVMASIDTEDVLYLATKTRGKWNAETLLWDFFEAIRVSDAYWAYKNLIWICQLCWAHPFRYIRTLAQTKTLKINTKKHCIKSLEEFSKIYKKLNLCLKEDFNEEQRQVQKLELINLLKDFCKPHKKDPKKLEDIKKLLIDRMDEYLTCMNYAWVPSDNNKAERKLRHFVIKRKISFWNTSTDWADAFSINASVLMTYWKKYPENLFSKLMELVWLKFS